MSKSISHGSSQSNGVFYFHCSKCKQKLCCGRHALVVECPICHELCAPYAEYVTTCITCHSKLHYPPCAQVIQCTHKRCGELMDVSKNPITECTIARDDTIVATNMDKTAIDHKMKRNQAAPYKTAFEWFAHEHKHDEIYKTMSANTKAMQLQCHWNALNRPHRDKYIRLSLNDRKKYFKALQRAPTMEVSYDDDTSTQHKAIEYEPIVSMHSVPVPQPKYKTKDRNKTKDRSRNITDRNKKAYVSHEANNVSLDHSHIAFASKCHKALDHWDIEDICEWLNGIGMDRYVEILKPQFIEDGIIGTDLAHISMLDLQDYGIRDSNHRRWILRNIKNLNTNE